MTQKHTPGPGEHTKGRLEQRGGTRIHFANEAGGFDIRDCPAPIENARRLVACWNALVGVDTDFIERVTQSPGFTIIEHLQRDRDELLAVCEREAAMPCRCAAPHSQCISCAARAAIQKAKVGK